MMGVQVNSKFHNVGTMWLGTLEKKLFQRHNQGYQKLQNYFGSSHGKGECDGIGVMVKRELWKGQSEG